MTRHDNCGMLRSMSNCLLYVTVKDAAEAQKIAQALVSEKLAACANILPGMTSVYRWNDAVETESENVLILKTTQSLADRAMERVLALHSYDCPCVLVLPVDGGNPAFLAWMDAQTGA